ncbi:hypothetical protein L9F63_002959 [Diploptera punctata]|uniref:Mitochondrial cardiolipin hydrolase n=1 Tax=Diploptera punctata TaxID=6984 RepID=A0AAD7ZR00_DIPPU|nr:hypothetical protein L9F63_002959 [Diploptera punctata]
MFFTDKGVECKDDCYKKNICSKKEGCAYQNLRRLVNLFESSTKTLDICIYLLTSKQMAEAISKVKRKGVKVRIIADGDMSFCSGSQIDILRREGVFVRTKKSPFLMHHKFAIIDNNILINGSCNWTMQGLTGNWDNILVTSVPDIVQPYSEHFNMLWKEFSEQSVLRLI